MQISGSSSALDKFLAAKKMAEGRMNSGSIQSVTANNSPKKSSFMDILKGASNNDDKRIDIPKKNNVPLKVTPKPAEVAQVAEVQKSTGLFSAYTINRTLGIEKTGSSANQVIMKNKHLGNFFDKVA